MPHSQSGLNCALSKSPFILITRADRPKLLSKDSSDRTTVCSNSSDVIARSNN